MTELWSILVPTTVSAVITVFVTLSVKLSIERKFLAAAATAEENRKRRIRFTEARSAWMWAAGRVLYHLVRIAQGRAPANGDLENSYSKLEAAESEMKCIERGYAAEAQED